MWKCPRCEVLNEDHRDECEVCFFHKASITETNSAVWICPRCETINDGKRNTCEVCFGPKLKAKTADSENTHWESRMKNDSSKSEPTYIDVENTCISDTNKKGDIVEEEIDVNATVASKQPLVEKPKDSTLPEFNWITEEEKRAEEALVNEGKKKEREIDELNQFLTALGIILLLFIIMWFIAKN